MTLTEESPPLPARIAKIFALVLVQALVWAFLTVAFAALLRLSGPQTWDNALRFAAVNWMPWAVLAPLVFWFTRHFPLERGHLLRSIPAHILGCAGCVGATLWFAASVGFWLRPPARTDDRPPPPLERYGNEATSALRGTGAADDRTPGAAPRADEPASRHRAAASGDDGRRNGPSVFPRVDRPDRLDRFRGEPREHFGRRGPFWWPLLGAALQRANFDAAVYLIVVIAAHALAFYRRAKDRERDAIALAAGLNRAKLDALRLQLQPHFLFNTLNAISTLVHRDASAADELIGDLSDLLRLSLQTRDHEVPLSRELELLDRYLAIEQARLGDRLHVQREIDPTSLSALVPTFLLQPVVENAIRHGIEPRVAPGTVTIRSRHSGDRLELWVEDDGVGLPSADPKPGARRGIGIANTEARLRTLHGDAATFSLAAGAAGGVVVHIVVPYVTAERAGAQAPAP